MFCGYLEKFQTKKTLNQILTIFKNEKKDNILIDCYNNLTVGINIIELYINIISNLGITIIFYLYSFLNFLEGEY